MANPFCIGLPLSVHPSSASLYAFEWSVILTGLQTTLESHAIIRCLSVHVILLTHSHSSVRVVGGLAVPKLGLIHRSDAVL